MASMLTPGAFAKTHALKCDRQTSDPLRVMLLVSSLEFGGAERQAVYLANGLDRARFEVVVCSLSNQVPLGAGLWDRERRLEIVPKRWRFDFTAVRRVAELMRKHRTQVVHAVLFDAEITARLAAKRAGVPVVIGSERNTDYRRSLLQKVVLRLTRPLCHAWIANSQSGGRFVQRQQGLCKGRVFVVHNGVDVERFRPMEAGATRKDLGISDGELAVGMVASFKPQKNHEMFFRVAAQLRDKLPRVRFLCVGEKLQSGTGARFLRTGAGFHARVDDYHRRMLAMIEELKIGDRLALAGSRTDLPSVYNALDVTVLTSFHEGTPNVVLESMACGTPVVITNVSDNAMIVRDGREGFVVNVNDCETMTLRLLELLSNTDRRRAMGHNARERAAKEFSLKALCDKTAAIYEAEWNRKCPVVNHGAVGQEVHEIAADVA